MSNTLRNFFAGFLIVILTVLVLSFLCPDAGYAETGDGEETVIDRMAGSAYEEGDAVTEGETGVQENGTSGSEDTDGTGDETVTSEAAEDPAASDTGDGDTGSEDQTGDISDDAAPVISEGTGNETADPAEETGADGVADVENTDDLTESEDGEEQPAEEPEEQTEEEPEEQPAEEQAEQTEEPEEQGPKLESDGRFYLDGVLQKNCWVEYDGRQFFADPEGYPYKNRFIKFGSTSYYMGSDGSVQTDRVINVSKGQYYYAGGDGIITKNQWVRSNGQNAYFADPTGAFYTNRFIKFGKTRYYMKSDGSVARGPVAASDGNHYYADPESGVLVTSQGWINAEDGKKYFVRPDGALYRNQFIKFGSIRYYMKSDGSVAKGSFTAADGNRYYADAGSGIVRMTAGWITAADGKRYFIKADGTMFKDQFIRFGSVRYYIGPDGSMQTGIITLAGNKLYYAQSDGKIRSTAGWIDYDGKRYFAREGGELYRKQFISFGNKVHYYLSKDGSAVKGEQFIGGRNYTFNDDYTLVGKPLGPSKGIDVSVFQGDINWAKVKKAGISFAFVRAGGRGGSSGKLYDDEKFTENVIGAVSNGLHVGAYFFTQAVSTSEAIEEANYICNKSKGLGLDLPIVIDTEELIADGVHCRHNNISREVRTAVIRAFCEQVRAKGYTPMIYGSTSWLEDMLDMSKLPYEVWVAQYYDSCQYEGDYTFWQYSETGRVSGIDGYVDMNYWY